MGHNLEKHMKYTKSYLNKINEWYKSDSNYNFLSRHPEFEKFEMPKTFYFRILPHNYRVHWAIIKPADKYVNIYFINIWGRVFDKLEFKNIKIARRKLRQNGFNFSTNRYFPFTPPEPIYIKLSRGPKSAPYSKGKLWKPVQRNIKHIKKLENTYIKKQVKNYEYFRMPIDMRIPDKPKTQNNKVKEGIIILLIIFSLVFILTFLAD